MTYELPRTESGEVDWRLVQHHLQSAWGVATFDYGIFDEVIQSIDANARAEERQECLAICEGQIEREAGYGGAWEGYGPLR